MRKTQLLRPDVYAAWLGASEVGKERVCTLCTPWAADRVVLVPDWDGLRRFFGGVAEIQLLEPGSSPTSGTCFPCSGARGPLSVHKLFTLGPSGAYFCWCAVAVAGGSFSWFGQRWRCLLVHGPGCRQLHDWTLAGGAVLPLLVCIS